MPKMWDNHLGGALALRFRNTPIHGETMREGIQKKADIETACSVFSKIADDLLGVQVAAMRDNPTPLAYRILNKFLEIPEMVAPESVRKENLERMRVALQSEYVELMCMDCGRRGSRIRVQDLDNKPLCSSCGSGLLAVINKHRSASVTVAEKWFKDQALTPEEQKVLVRTRRMADLALSYGKKAVMALLIWGIGPQTAAQILAKMHKRDEDFFADLLKAKLKYIQTRQFWD